LNEQISGEFDAVVLAVPAEQAAVLLQPVSPSMATEALAAHTLPCWTALLAFAAPLKVGFEAARVTGASPLAWVAQMPGSSHGISCWVVQATSDWSRRHLEDPAESVAAELARAFSELSGIAAPPLLQSAHRWRYAQVQTAVGSPFAWDPDLRIGACGDWRLGPRIELAWQSGDALGAAISLMKLGGGEAQDPDNSIGALSEGQKQDGDGMPPARSL
jgi:predicted NAD/FAD-dependent oxidoreductase